MKISPLWSFVSVVSVVKWIKWEKEVASLKKCGIFCAGGFAGRLPDEADVIIAADGGLTHTAALGLRPDVILGDFDSLGYVPTGSEVFPVEKDDTDSMLAIKRGLELGCDRFYIYGGLDGDRVEHTMANFQALQYISQRGGRGYLIGCRQIVTAITADEICFPETFAGYLSVFCMGADAQNVCIRGAQYALENGILTSGFPLGVSNRFVGQKVTVSVEDGTLLLIWDRENGIP